MTPGAQGAGHGAQGAGFGAQGAERRAQGAGRRAQRVEGRPCYSLVIPGIRLTPS